MLYRLVVRSIIAGFLIASGACLALAGEPGSTERPAMVYREIAREVPTHIAEPAGGVPTDPALFDAWSRHQIRLKELELQERRLQHQESLDYKRLELQREREQLRYAQRGYSSYSRNRSYGGDYYPAYVAPEAPVYQRAAYYPTYVPSPAPYYGASYGGYEHTRSYRPSRSYDYYRHNNYGHGCGIGLDFGLHLGH